MNEEYLCAIIMILSCVVSVSAQDDTTDGVVGILDEPTLKYARILLYADANISTKRRETLPCCGAQQYHTYLR